MSYELVVINGSERGYSGETGNAIGKVVQELQQLYHFSNSEIRFYTIPTEFTGCQNCDFPSKESEKRFTKNYCRFNTEEDSQIMEDIINCKFVLFASPVYLDTPTGKMLNFLHRLTCISEKSGRTIFNNILAYTLAVGYCSGTKTVCHTLFGALEMLGFTIPPRSSRELILLWHDKKIRGGIPTKK